MMLPQPPAIATLPDGAPLLQVVVDTEEEFDWSKPFDRRNTSVQTVEAQWRAQEIFDAYGVKPTYVVDYPVATNPRSVAILKALLDTRRCQIGAHLHPWVNPPFDEAVLASNSYPGNLSPGLERRKLQLLTDAVSMSFRVRPTIYKAGRYGLGPETPDTLAELGYLVDLSVVPHTDFGSQGGPDFRGLPDRPYWLRKAGGVLEIPLSRGFSGLGSWARNSRSYERIQTSWGGHLKLGILSRLALLERATLTPEGVSFASQRRLVRSLLCEGHRVLTLSYHSPSLAPGHSPYVRSGGQLREFLASIRRTLDFVLGDLGGHPATPLDIRQLSLAEAGRREQARGGAEAPRITRPAGAAPEDALTPN